MKLRWRKSSYSGGEGNCVEIADHPNRVFVRDTKDRTGPTLRFTPHAWRVFADQVKRSLASDPQIKGGRSRTRVTRKVVRAGQVACFWRRCPEG